MVYYNDNDPFCVEWLKELVKAGMIAPGEVDSRSIHDVKGSDLTGYTQCHFFAGIGGWSYALRLAGVPDNYPLWTGSCPCQPFSVAGKGKGTADERHLWPELRRLISECNSPTVFGEQVASKAGRLWLSGVFADLEALGYSRAGADLCAAGLGAPHIRQRLYWVAQPKGIRLERRSEACQDQQEWNSGSDEREPGVWPESGGRGFDSWLADSEVSEWRSLREEHGRRGASEAGGPSGASSLGVGISNSTGSQQGSESSEATGHGNPIISASWNDYALIPCRDGKTRRIPTEPALFPLAPRIPGRVGRVGILRGSGNSIVPQVAAEFIQAFFEVRFL